MDTVEFAGLATLKALEQSMIVLKKPEEGTAEQVNAFNAAEIAKFYREIYQTITKS